MKFIALVSILCLPLLAQGQTITSQQLLQKSMAYHDPNNQWEDFKGTLEVTMTTPNNSPRKSVISIDIPNEYFKVVSEQGTENKSYSIDKGECALLYNGMELKSSEAEKHNMTCERADMYKNYYTYLYGLPMKLKDPGTQINYPVEKRKFKGKNYLVLKVTYDDSVGSDVWYFYFDPTSYAMEIYQFFKTDDQGDLIPKSGEYILLSEEAIVNDIKMPKVRAWHYNKDNGYLGTDTLSD